MTSMLRTARRGAAVAAVAAAGATMSSVWGIGPYDRLAELRLCRIARCDPGEGTFRILSLWRGAAHAFHPGGHPVLFLIEAFRDVLARRAAILGGPVQRFLHVHR